MNVNLHSHEMFKNFREQRELMEDKIKLGIESHRKGYFKICFADSEGNPVRGARLKIRQKTHEFKFGANLFKLGCFENPEENALYEERFANLFNMATLPLYWSDFEPQDGAMRFEKDSPFIDRRIPPELGLEFCRKHGIEAKGHPLFWQVMMPDWLPRDYEEIKPYWVRRLRAIAERYDGVIKSFDCVNECTGVPYTREEPHKNDTHYRNFCPIDNTYPSYAFEMTNRFFPASRLVLNETSYPWHKGHFRGELSPYYMLAEKLIREGKRVDVIGFQWHDFMKEADMKYLASHYDPRHLYAVMDCYEKLNRPMSVTEITFPGYDEGAQAETLYNLYRIWFSQAGMESIIYWNLGDNCAISGKKGWEEDAYRSGLVDSSFRPKESYRVLEDLIKREWHTDLDLDADGENVFFKAFYGDYEVTAERGGKTVTRELKLTKKGYDTFYFEF